MVGLAAYLEVEAILAIPQLVDLDGKLQDLLLLLGGGPGGVA